MIRALFRDGVIYAVPALLSRGLAFFLIPLYTRVLSTADYGSLDLFLLFTHIVKLTIALEVAQGLARYYTAETDQFRRIYYSSSAFWFTFAVYTAFLLVMWFNAASISSFLMGQGDLDVAFKIGLFYIWIQGIFYLAQTQLRFEFRAKEYAIVSIVMSLLAALLSVFFAVFLDMGLEGLLLGMLGGSAAGTTLGLWWLRKNIKFCFDAKSLKHMLSFSAPLVLSSVAVWATLYVDRLMINYLLSVDDVGLYGLGYRVASISGLLLVGFQGALTPLIYANHEKLETPEQLATIFRYFFAGSVIVFLVLSLFSDGIISFLAPKEYSEAASVVTLLVPAILLGNMYIFTPGMAIRKRTDLFAKINAGGAILNFVLNIVLIPKMGIQGAALATLLSYVAIFSLYLFWSQKMYYVPHFWWAFVYILILSGGIVGLYSFLAYQGMLAFFLDLGAVIVVSIFLFYFGVLKFDELKSLITHSK